MKFSWRKQNSRITLEEETAAEIVVELLKQLSTTSTYRLTGWAKVLKYARRYAMIECFDQFDDEDGNVIAVRGDDKRKALEECSFKLGYEARRALAEETMALSKRQMQITPHE